MQNLPWFEMGVEKSIFNKRKIHKIVALALQISPEEILELEILRQSLDARKKSDLKFIYRVAVQFAPSVRPEKFPGIKSYSPPAPPAGEPFLEFAPEPIIVGTGPAGLFTALGLVEKGLRPVLLEQGKEVRERILDVKKLWREGILTENSNVQFGEGGAGTFSDGKLTARSQDFFSHQVLHRLVEFGAPPEILYEQKPHIGTDRLRLIVPRLRHFLVAAGAQFLFNHSVKSLEIENGQVCGVQTTAGAIRSKTVVLAIGHSARETYRALAGQGIALEAKAFAVGVRVEHPREFIDLSQYGTKCDFKITGSADYKLTFNWLAGKRGVYSFCMCPGGHVILSSSHPGGIVTNGMSNHSRQHLFSNAGIVVTVHPADFPGKGVLAGLEFQEEIEAKAFQLGEKSYFAPAQWMGDFLRNRVSRNLPEHSFQPGAVSANVGEIFPASVTEALKQGFQVFERQIRGFIQNGLILAPETRTSAPVRILRQAETFESVNCQGLFPIGEGAGYAGGIVSSAADGLKLAWRVKPRG
jgi:uncharacterized FAD-dependent dehydrogenase